MYYSEEEEMYHDRYYGLFSKKLAEWAISHMVERDPATKEVKKLRPKSPEEVEAILKENKIEMPEDFVYTAWYLYNMALADYPKSLKTNEQRAMFVEETLQDPDGSPENVLNCFVAKMCEAKRPIYWEKFL